MLERIKGIDWTGTLQAQSLNYGNRYTGDPTAAVPNIGDVGGLADPVERGEGAPESELFRVVPQPDGVKAALPAIVPVDHDPAFLQPDRPMSAIGG